ncbi:50S ribosomal protein L9 [Blattabacterium cuenoti]|uniref:50S ribosomal protein L9 n=1 Tax=Blattabacterium cuenoti TaxID=1653831 RepID=UPI00163B9A39|nr:50S ribosomal protein L9 [Blattabacterium cuenoti]
MKIILKKDLENLGFLHDEIDVKPGYARNYLIPRGLAVESSLGLLKNNKEILKQRSRKEDSLIKKAHKIEKKLKDLVIKIPVKVSKDGKLFGSINNQYIMNFLSKKGIFIEKKFIRIHGKKTIKSIGKYQASIRLHRKKEFLLDFEVLVMN